MNSFNEEKKEDESDLSANLKPFLDVDYKMVVFDKDGTLGDDKGSLKRWAEHMTESLCNELLCLGRPSESVAYDVARYHTKIGWDPIVKDVTPSAPLAADTWERLRERSAKLFAKMGIDKAEEKVNMWHDSLGNVHHADAPLIDDLRGLMLQLKARGLLVAICTSDDRSPTNAAVTNWNLEDVIDHSICGNEVLKGKPNPEPLEQLCKMANVTPRDCIVVGDTDRDTGMATNAGAGMCIGVLTGSGTYDQLKKSGAHFVLDHVGNILSILEAIGMREKSGCDDLCNFISY